MRVALTPDDLKKSDLVESGWYPAEIINYHEEDAKTDGSTNGYFTFKIIAPSPEKAQGVQPRKMFNEKALGFGKNLWSTLKLPFDAKKGYEISSELLAAQVGKKLQIYIKRGKSDRGNEFNDVVDFRPLPQSAPTA